MCSVKTREGAGRGIKKVHNVRRWGVSVGDTEVERGITGTETGKWRPLRLFMGYRRTQESFDFRSSTEFSGFQQGDPCIDIGTGVYERPLVSR